MKKLYLFLVLLLGLISAQAQSDCSNAVTAVEGSNSFSATADEPYWLTYELPAGKKASFSSEVALEFSISSGTNCNNRDNYTSGYQDASFSALEMGGFPTTIF